MIFFSMKDKLLVVLLKIELIKIGNWRIVVYVMYIFFLIIIVIYIHCKKIKTDIICKKKLPVISPP